MNEYREMVGLDVFASGGNEIVSAAKSIEKRRNCWAFWPIKMDIFTGYRCHF